MKNRMFILMLLSSLTAYAQFPAPTDFSFGYSYIMIDQGGYCEGNWVSGPAYCSDFSWTAPDTTSTEAHLEYYNLYYYQYYPSGMSDSTIILTSLSSTFVELQVGILGAIWVTAVYSGPDGESEPSNVIINESLPISVEENPKADDMIVFYDKVNHELIIRGKSDISGISLVDARGRKIMTHALQKDRINLEGIPGGVYIVEMILGNHEVIRKKIVK
ncbi:MAG TPA: T9SS type A sorting domain-containing protein [Bacteroidales bacterium]|nr:T9SS type A sorting domain-containing protein [Bacteroidales bacterium]